VTTLKTWLLELARTTMEREGSEDAAHDYDHLARTMTLAESIQEREGGDLATIQAAVALHDIGQAREARHGGDHAQIGADIAAELLAGSMFPQEGIPAVHQAIHEHRMTGGMIPRTLEGRILYDADKIDCLGAIGIGRLYIITGRYNQKVYSPVPDDIIEPIDPMLIRSLRRRPDYSPSIEFQLLFANLPDRMTTPTGCELAQERYAFMEMFFTQLRKEVQGEL
jgi:uncharacterized protein